MALPPFLALPWPWLFFFFFLKFRFRRKKSFSFPSSTVVRFTASAPPPSSSPDLELPDALQQLPAGHVRPKPDAAQQRQLQSRELRRRHAADARDHLRPPDAVVGQLGSDSNAR